MLVLAYAVAVLHAAVVALFVGGSLLALRWPRLLRLHAPLALTILVLALAGASCPLTDLELALREAAGVPGYTGGFIGHYVLAPFGVDVRTTGAQVGINATAIFANAVGYGLHVRRVITRSDPLRTRPSRTATPLG